jgi:phosphoribosylglycinamide formyltransferase 1
MNQPRLRTAILISGGGSNMAALAKAAQAADYPAEIMLVVANIPDAGGLSKARELGLMTATVDHKPFGKDREAFERALDQVLRINQIELVVLAGFMRIMTPWFVSRWTGRMINIHPSLLPAYKGTHTHERALADKVGEHGCTVHFVVPELDSGPVIAQARVPVLADDTPETLAARVLVEEHRLYPSSLAAVASGKVQLVDGVVVETSAA